MRSTSGWHIIFQPFYTALLKHSNYWHKLIHFHQKFSVDTQGHCIFHHSDRQELNSEQAFAKVWPGLFCNVGAQIIGPCDQSQLPHFC